MSNEMIERLTDQEFYARGIARSRYHDRLFVEGKPRPTNEQFDEGWEAARTFYRADHERIVKELEADRSEWQSVAEKYQALVKRTEQSTISDAIKEVERTRDRYRAAGESSGLPNDMTASRDIHTANVLDRLVIRLNALGTQE
jgi:hypothetical protein